MFCKGFTFTNFNSYSTLPNGSKNHFELLKQKIVATMKQSYPGINPSISDWKGQEITDFQEELLKAVNAHISEKWFYNHIKKDNRSLPRIDVLNLLSKYAGYANWDDFVFKNKGVETSPEPPKVKANRYFILVPLLVVITVLAFMGLYMLVSTGRFTFSFYDAVTKETITGSGIEIKILKTGESPDVYFADASGTLSFRTGQRKIKLVVIAPYYKTDTIVRTLRSFDRNERIGLQADDYALMIHYFSEMKTEDWLKRREQLNRIIDDNAMIYQVMGGSTGTGMELFNKVEFIDKLTIPAGSLKNLEILDTKYKGERIVVLKFRVKEF